MTIFELLGAMGLFFGGIVVFVIAALCLLGFVCFCLEKLGYIDTSEYVGPTGPYIGSAERARLKREANNEWARENINYMTGKLY